MGWSRFAGFSQNERQPFDLLHMALINRIATKSKLVDDVNYLMLSCLIEHCIIGGTRMSELANKNQSTKNSRTILFKNLDLFRMWESHPLPNPISDPIIRDELELPRIRLPRETANRIECILSYAKGHNPCRILECFLEHHQLMDHNKRHNENLEPDLSYNF